MKLKRSLPGRSFQWRVSKYEDSEARISLVYLRNSKGSMTGSLGGGRNKARETGKSQTMVVYGDPHRLSKKLGFSY